MRGYQPEEMLNYYMGPLTLAQVHSCLAYYFDHREEIDRQIREDDEFVARMKAEGGLLDKLRGSGAGGDSLSL